MSTTPTERYALADFSPEAQAYRTVPFNPQPLCEAFAPKPAPSEFWCATCGWSEPMHDDETVRTAIANELAYLAAAATTNAVRCLTVHQPWAFAIAEGFKTIENRTRRTHYRGPVWIHAGKTLRSDVEIVRCSREAARRLQELGGRSNFWDAVTAVPSHFYTPPTTLALRAVIATATLTGCHHPGDTACGPACATWGQPDAWHWELADARPLTAPVPVNGALGLWKPTVKLAQSVHAHTPAAVPTT